MPLPANVQPLLETIIGALAGLSKTTDGIPRKYAALFMDLPSQIDYPDYYVYIQQPKSINQVLVSFNFNFENRCSQIGGKEGIED